MCALKWYKNLYRHIFLEDISKHARVTQKIDFLICGTLYSQTPWPQRPKLGVRVAKGLSCDISGFFFGFFLGNTPPPPLRYRAEKRQDHGICRTPTQISVVPPLLSSISQGGFYRKKQQPLISQRRPLATRTPSLGRCGQGALEFCRPQIRKYHFFSDPCVFGYIF